MHSQHRTTGNHIITSICLEILERCRYIRKFLYLIKEQERSTWNESQHRIQCRHPLYDILCLIAICRNLLELRLKNEIDFDDIFIIGVSEVPNRLRLANLTSTFNKKRLTVGIF